MVLFGSSLGGYLAPRAAAFDERIDGVVCYGVMFDFLDTVRARTPAPVRPLVAALVRGGWARTLSLFQRLRMRHDPGMRWGFGNMRWTTGATNLIEVERTLASYSLAEIAHRITADVLVLHGSADHLIPAHQLDALTTSLVNARSVTVRVHGPETGGQEHCHQGATLLWQEDLFDWLAEKFPGPG